MVGSLFWKKSNFNQCLQHKKSYGMHSLVLIL